MNHFWLPGENFSEPWQKIPLPEFYGNERLKKINATTKVQSCYRNDETNLFSSNISHLNHIKQRRRKQINKTKKKNTCNKQQKKIAAYLFKYHHRNH